MNVPVAVAISAPPPEYLLSTLSKSWPLKGTTYIQGASSGSVKQNALPIALVSCFEDGLSSEAPVQPSSDNDRNTHMSGASLQCQRCSRGVGATVTHTLVC